MSNQQQLTRLVTGCSSGLGEALTKAILQRGDRVVATARNVASISHLKALGATTLQLDVTVPFEVIEANLRQAIAVHGSLDIVVNNAGSMQFGAVEDLNENLLQPQLATNFFGPLNIAKAVLPHFRSRKAGTIIQISSGTPWTGGPGLGAHSATKAAAEALFSTMASEVQTFGIKTLIVQPGSFRTNITNPKGYNFPSTTTYADTMGWMEKHLADLDGTQKGDPAKFGKAVVDLIHGEALAKEAAVPLKVIIGDDVTEFRKAWLQKESESLSKWTAEIGSTHVDEAVPKHDASNYPAPWRHD